MISRVPYYGEIVQVLSALASQFPESPLASQAVELVKQSEINSSRIDYWVPVVKIPNSEWNYLAIERAAGIQYGFLLLARVHDLRSIYNTPVTEEQEAVLAALVDVRGHEWVLLEPES